MCVLSKKGKLEVVNGTVSGNLKNVAVSEYKPLLSEGHLVIVEGKKYILLKKEEYKCYLLGLDGSIKKLYYKFIDYLYFTLEASRDKDVIQFLKNQDMGLLSVVDYDNTCFQYKCVDGLYHSYSYLITQYLKKWSKTGVVYG